MKNKFVIVAPTFNAEKTCRQTILSLAAQTYQDWRLIVIDDVSTDRTASVISELMHDLHLADKLMIVHNSEKKWEIENTLKGLQYCDDDEIVCRLDMDDYLIDNTSLQVLDMFYSSEEELDAVWSAHRWFEGDQLSNQNISGPMKPGSDPYKHPWVSSHFKTFKKKLLKDVKDSNYRGQDGEYFRRIGDQAFMLPALKNARKWFYVPMVMYAYRCSLKPETFQTDDAKFQAAEAQFLRTRGYVG